MTVKEWGRSGVDLRASLTAAILAGPAPRALPVAVLLVFRLRLLLWANGSTVTGRTWRGTRVASVVAFAEAEAGAIRLAGASRLRK